VSGKLQKLPVDPSRVEVLDGEETGPEVGQWYWVKDDDEDDEKPDRWLGCVVWLGSNYIKIEGLSGAIRIHVNNFDNRCEVESDPDSYIDGRIKHYSDKVAQLMGRVKELTSRLGVAPSPMLAAGSETKALALIGGGADMGDYKAALVKAKDEQLPDLFKEIERNNTAMADWMTAKVIPLKAQARGMKGSIKTIEDRIFNVELYAGLTEQVTQIAEGNPAELSTKIHLLQRQCYMDEECLADYQTGGMDFNGIEWFDRWICTPRNLERILPFERCIVSFQVRRNKKIREMVSLRDLLRIVGMEEADEQTFLYIRNGQQVFRMSTELEFGGELFPDLDRRHFDGGKLWADTRWGGSDIRSIITDDQLQGLKEDYARAVKKYDDKQRAWDEALKTPEAQQRAEDQGLDEPDDSCVDLCWPGHGWIDNEAEKYTPFTPDNVYYDDIAGKLKRDIDHHNRIALIFQGLLDRSPVLHPHPPWQIWTNDGFESALTLIYDESRALSDGPTPDFEAYRAELNKSLKSGSVVVGQDEAWLISEGKKESRRLDRDYNYRGDYRPTRHRPHGNPGPGLIARILKFGKRSRKATFAWDRERSDWRGDKEDKIRTTFSCSDSALLNVEAYRPGDFHKFFDDPRTRQDYLKWAPLLLEAEEYHAGNRKVWEPVAPVPKPASSYEAQRRYRIQKRRKHLMGKAVRLTRPIRTRGGKEFEVGSLWRVYNATGKKFDIEAIQEDGSCDDCSGIGTILGVHEHDFEEDESIPAEDSAAEE